MQALRAGWDLRIEPFWVILGVLILGAISPEIETAVPLVPVILILFGLAALVGVYRRLRASFG
jgi:hypothetical protein